MATQKLPPFAPVTLAELRRIWQEHPAEDVRRLTLEVARYRQVIAEIDGHYRHIHQSWRDTVGGELFALHLLKQLMYTERQRLG
ncbi:TPA: hypothetical protein ACIJ20_005737 [Pseudomonas aeruginosa]|uniref:Uncharacterized protein n=1 Tax=Pseudomonas aeruginosa TaxID=287 RepID=A0A6B1YJ03_PSEAI|nr:hypothetical protein [Pseudomonas aeruginosa]SSV53563.1 Uncharacterised protein [Acinetobacter baumannii]APB61002.1 hypothetical protein PA7790_07062 [Pseudomonas aeruginosa]ERY99860.1 hypothetical protein Q020_06258 [Pseudomonas aeruginosa BWHPSA007]EZO40850.1 hypothetical protein V562_05758 [Pseudomonas aeruginosa PS75]KAA5621965.1 hypothetical protein F3H11_31965 [Pseudomonas aeruginosa]